MDNDIYRRVIRELSNKSQHDFGFQRVDSGQAKITQLIIRVIFLLLQLFAIVFISVYIALHYNDTSNLTINLYTVISVAAILGTLNYPAVWRKFTNRRTIFITMLISGLSIAIILSPARVLPVISNRLPFYVAWGIIITVTSIFSYFWSNTIVLSAEVLLDLAGVFVPILPATVGGSLANLTSKAYNMLLSETVENEKGRKDLKYLISAAQADIDSASIRSLPWVVLIGLGTASFSELFSGKVTLLNILLGASLLAIGLIAVFTTARMTYFQALIIQVANRLLIDLPEADNEQQKKPQSWMISAETNQPGCFLKVLLPWKRWK
jgi:hypothetical protein